MVKFSMKVDSNDEALAGEDGYSHELARILRDVQHKVEDGQTGGNIRDINGVKVGSWKVR